MLSASLDSIQTVDRRVVFITNTANQFKLQAQTVNHLRIHYWAAVELS